ncbi:DUF421 domain-containing protein [Mechercharimyces sp. CAU 1602]|nr:DUF421 domain-containing protein [Mechercharimyces sp. CAU 1602]
MIWLLKGVLIILAGTLLLRVAGRKSISQMTLAQTIIMISLGTLLIQPVSNKDMGTTFAIAASLILTLLAMELGQLLFHPLELWITGKAVVVIENGTLHIKNMRKLRLTTAQLETRLRQEGIAFISDVKWATLEPSGQIGYELMDHKKPLTRADFASLQDDAPTPTLPSPPGNLFEKVASPKKQ